MRKLKIFFIKIDGFSLTENLLNNSIACGALNIISAIGGLCASSGTALGTGLGKTISGILSVMTEATYDDLTLLIGEIIKLF